MNPPFRPQPEADLAARYPEALKLRFDGDRPPDVMPRANVFDFDPGLRLIVSIDYCTERGGVSRPFLHLSASAGPGTLIYNQIAMRSINQKGFIQLLRDCFALISGDTEPLTFECFGPSGGPHFTRPWAVGVTA